MRRWIPYIAASLLLHLAAVGLLALALLACAATRTDTRACDGDITMEDR
jgi:hypothetical protein